MSSALSLQDKLEKKITAYGPLTVEAYMASCLGDPDFGYYRKKPAIGAAGDFITAPEISQIFGELIGLWAAESWRLMGAPGRCKLIELGPGRGTLMKDVLRAAKLVPDFLSALDIHLIEINAHLKAQQKKQLCSYEGRICWHQTLEEVKAGAAIIVANEFIDALPVRQLIFDKNDWYERAIGLGEDGSFCFQLSGKPLKNKPSELAVLRTPEEGDIFEYRPRARDFFKTLANRCTAAPTVALIIDYGPLESQFGDTLQALRTHQYISPLEVPGEADLTSHVDFQGLRNYAETFGLKSWGPLTQGYFLSQLGLGTRTAQLIEKAGGKKQAHSIETAAKRLVDPDQMGTLFKVLAVGSKILPPPPPFGD